MNQAKKQNRILLAVLVVTLAAAAVLLALTGTANRKKAETKPAAPNKAEEKLPAEEAPSPGRQESAMPSLPGSGKKPEEKKADEKKEPEKTAGVGAEAEEEPPVLETSSDSVLPRFTAPVDGFVLKECSPDVPVFSCTMNDYRTHAGLDFACSPGTPVCAAADGVICDAYRDPMMGVTISIRHDGGAVTTYRGLSEGSLEMSAVGQPVSAGQAIGSSGSTALIESAEEDHLHFELTVDGVHEDPADYMDVRLLARQPED